MLKYNVMYIYSYLGPWAMYVLIKGALSFLKHHGLVCIPMQLSVPNVFIMW